MTFTRINQHLIHYRLSGKVSAPVLVLVNSLGTDFRIWDQMAGPLSASFRLLCYDKRGHGLSDVPPGPYTIQDHIDDLSGLLHKLDIEQASICGVSVGGAIALGLAAKYPVLVHSLLLCDCLARFGQPQVWEQRMTEVEKNGIESIADTVMQRWFTDAYHASQPEALSGWRNMLVRSPVDGYLATCAAIRDADLSAEAASISVPTLVVCGEQDGSTPPEQVEAFSRMIPGAQFRLIKNAGHLPGIEQAGIMIDLISNFISQSNQK